MACGSKSIEVLACLLAEEIIQSQMLSLVAVTLLMLKRRSRKHAREFARLQYSLIGRIPQQVSRLNRLVHISDADCLANLRMDRNSFGKLCFILKGVGGLEDSKFVSVESQVAMFLGVIAHHKKNRVTGFDFLHSGETVHHYVHAVLGAILKIHRVFLLPSTPIREDCDDPRWKYFQGCIGALDGTYLQVSVPGQDKPRFRNQKGQICTNTLACCDMQMRFTYVLPGWEGSAADGRVLRDAVNRHTGLKLPKDCYYLCDSGFANSPGFLTPLKGVRYHLKEWGPESRNPTSPEEIYNFRHVRARNVIERAFGLLKMRWGILRSPSFYPLKVQIRLIMCCFLLHNFVRAEMSNDPIEVQFDENDGTGGQGEDATDQGQDDEYIDTVETNTDWNNFREGLAQSMWNEYCGR